MRIYEGINIGILNMFEMRGKIVDDLRIFLKKAEGIKMKFLFGKKHSRGIYSL